MQGEIRPVGSVGVIGSGTMGAGIAISLATGGYSVTLIDANATALEAGLQRVRTTIDASAKKGRLSADAAAQAIARVSGSGDFAALAIADLVIEAVFEKMSVKQEVFARLGQICEAWCGARHEHVDARRRRHCEAASGRAQDVVGMHFFSPANIMRLVEIVRGEKPRMRRSPPPPQ